MKTLRAIVSVLVLAAFSESFAQQPAAPPPKTDKGPSLAETMQLLQKELNAVGKVNYRVTTRDELGGPDHILTFTFEISNVVADSASCTVRYHLKSSTEDQVFGDEDFSLNLHDVPGVRVRTYAQFLKEEDGLDIADVNYQTNLYTRFNPPMIVLIPEGEDVFAFADEVIANRIAKILTQAVKLCGGGSSKQPLKPETAP